MRVNMPSLNQSKLKQSRQFFLRRSSGIITDQQRISKLVRSCQQGTNLFDVERIIAVVVVLFFLVAFIIIVVVVVRIVEAFLK